MSLHIRLACKRSSLSLPSVLISHHVEAFTARAPLAVRERQREREREKREIREHGMKKELSWSEIENEDDVRETCRHSRGSLRVHYSSCGTFQLTRDYPALSHISFLSLSLSLSLSLVRCIYTHHANQLVTSTSICLFFLFSPSF